MKMMSSRSAFSPPAIERGVSDASSISTEGGFTIFSSQYSTTVHVSNQDDKAILAELALSTTSGSPAFMDEKSVSPSLVSQTGFPPQIRENVPQSDVSEEVAPPSKQLAPSNRKRERQDAGQNDSGQRKSSRQRKRVEQVVVEPITYREEIYMKLALDRSKDEVVAPTNLSPEEALTLYPTEEEFHNPIDYIVRNRQIISDRGGIAKIVPPSGWSCPYELDESTIEISTKEQTINTLGEGVPYGTGSDYDPTGYELMANDFHVKWKQKMLNRGEDVNDLKMWEKMYWKIVEGGEEETVVVEYGNDVSTENVGGAFPRVSGSSAGNQGKMWEDMNDKADFTSRDYYATTEWNLTNIARARGSVLANVKDVINGINMPWLYFGMLFSTFSWHVEDNWFYSINYNHKGGVKLWYGISPLYQMRFDAEMKRNMPVRFAQDPDLLSDITTMLNPSYLISRDIPVVYLHQKPGEFVVTLPGAYHAGFSLGFNVGEAVNFAPLDWILPGRLCRDVYRAKKRKPVIAHDKLVWGLVNQAHLLSVEQLELLLSELRLLLKSERDARAHCEKDRLEFVVRMPDEEQDSDEKDMNRLCWYCQQPCSFHAVVCSCNKAQHVTCGFHHKSLCACPPTGKALVVWKTMKELQSFVDLVESELNRKRQLITSPSIPPL